MELRGAICISCEHLRDELAEENEACSYWRALCSLLVLGMGGHVRLADSDIEVALAGGLKLAIERDGGDAGVILKVAGVRDGVDPSEQPEPGPSSA